MRKNIFSVWVATDGAETRDCEVFLMGDIPELSGYNAVLWDDPAVLGRWDQMTHCVLFQPDPFCV